MSIFTKRRLSIRKQQEEKRKRWQENAIKTDKAFDDILETLKIIKEMHPEFESLDENGRINLFGTIFNEVHKEL